MVKAVMPPETFAQRLRSMELDLITIVDRMNKDSSHDKAEAAQRALNAIYSLRTMDPWLKELDWAWEPVEEEFREE